MAKQESGAKHQINFYSKTLAAEVTEWAAKESTGVPVPKNTLAKNVFAWAWPIYKAAGSLANLKKFGFENPKVPGAIGPYGHISAQGGDDTNHAFDSAHQARLENETLGDQEKARHFKSNAQDHHPKKKKRA